MVEINVSNFESVNKETKRSDLFYENIHYIRGVAMSLVVATHIGHYFSKMFELHYLIKYTPPILGQFAISTFFAISGFLMATILKRHGSFEFLARRLVRIYPMYLIATVFAIGLLGVLHGPQVIRGQFSAAMSLAPVGVAPYPLGVEWTLVMEVFYYTCLFIISVSGLTRFVPAIAIAWLMVLFARSMAGISDGPIAGRTMMDLPLLQINVAFASGLLIPGILSRISKPALPLAVFIICAILYYFIPNSSLRVAAGIGSAALVVTLLVADVSMPEWLRKSLWNLGEWSYGFYLVHVPLIIATYTLASAYLPITVLPLVALIVVAMAAFFFGSLDVAIQGRTKGLVRQLPKGMTLWAVLAWFCLYLGISLAFTA